jgi:carbon monoxide dehydrogenase subunit G
MRIACTIDIAAPIGDVFAFVSDPRNDPAWCPKVESVTAQGDGPAPGADYLVVHRPVPLRPARAMRYRLVDWDPPKAICWCEDDGHDRVEVAYHLQALGADSTRFTQTDDLDLGAPRLLHPLMRAGIRRDITHQLERLRDRLQRR